jgi:Secretion system C-terminal sorting domain
MINFSFAQSNRWLFGRDYVDVLAASLNTTLPGLAVNFKSVSGWNMRHDQNLNLSFCIQDGYVYNENNIDLGEIFVNTDAGLDEFYGYPEICIVPVPGSCSRYFIIGAYKYNFNATSGTGTNPKPAFATVDMNVYNPIASAFGMLDGANSAGDVIAADISNGAGVWTNINVHTSEMHLAVTRPRSDGSRILFITSGGYVYASYITSTGISTATLIYTSTVPTGGSGTLKSELEVYESTVGGSPNYTLAIPWGNASNYIEVLNFDQNLLPTNDYVIGPIVNTIGSNPLKGIEFSPNGQYIYYSTTGPDYLNCIDAANGVAVNLPNVNQNDIIKYGYSMIETGKDLNLYMVCSDCVSPTDPNPHTVLTQLNNPNNPSNLTFVDNWAELNYSHLDVSGVVPYSTFSAGSASIHVNIMPDQQDGENYLTVFNLDKECCNFNTDYHQDHFSAEESETWTPASNPLNGGAGNVAIIKNELEIMPNITVHIVGMELQFSLTGKIIVHPGAKLYIEGTKLNGNPICETMWKGIEVWSDIPTASMGEFYSLPDVSTGTRSSIEQALAGINFYDENNTLPTNPKDGGFMNVDRTDFKNNYISIIYNNHPINGAASVINNCEFSSGLGVTGLWYPHAGESAGIFLYASNVKANHLQLLGLYNKFDRAYHGIYLNETNSIQINDADFNNCVAGIYSFRPSNSGNASALNISSNKFNNTHTCIYILNGFEDQISSNSFNVSGGPQFQNFYGVFMDGSNGFRIVDNVYNRLKFGAFIYNSGPKGGVIDANVLGNIFNGCWRGIHTEKNNEALQIRCNEFHNEIQGSFDFSTAWYINGDLPDQGQPGTNASNAAGNYFFRIGNRQDLHAVMGNQANSCSGVHNFCYFLNQSPSDVNPVTATPLTISEQVNQAFQTSCTARARIMELANNDPNEAMAIIESEANAAVKAQYSLELTQWFKNQQQIDSLIAFLQEQNTEGSLEQLYSEYIQLDSVAAAQSLLTELEVSGNEELIAFARLNQILLNLKADGKSILEMDSLQLSVVDEYSHSEYRVSGQARAIKASIDDILQPIELEGDTGIYRLASGDMYSTDGNPTLQLLNNPVKDFIGVNILSPITEAELQISFFDVLGKEVASLTLPASNELRIPLEGVSNGNYILSVTQNEQKVGAINFSKF